MPFALKKTFTGATFYNKLARGLGVEIELSEWGDLEDRLFNSNRLRPLRLDLNAKKLWDRSVVPSNHELVVGPLFGDPFLRDMSKLIEVLLTSNATTSESCSVHTHVDARDVSIWGVRAALINYMRHEPEFVRMFPLSRIYPEANVNHGGYAKPMSKVAIPYAKLQGLHSARTASHIKRILIDYLYNIKNPDANFIEVVRKKSHKYEDCRYYGFNLHAFMMMGTFEFRQHEGAIGDDLIMWPLFCGHYSQAIVNHPTSKLMFLEFCDAYLPKQFNNYVVDRISKAASSWKHHETQEQARKVKLKAKAATAVAAVIPRALHPRTTALNNEVARQPRLRLRTENPYAFHREPPGNRVLERPAMPPPIPEGPIIPGPRELMERLRQQNAEPTTTPWPNPIDTVIREAEDTTEATF